MIKKLISFLLVILLSSSSTFPNSVMAKSKNYKAEPITFLVGGDIMLSRSVGALNKKSGSDRILKNYNPLNGYNNSLFIANLESPFSDPDKDVSQKTFSFGANVANVNVLNKMGNGKQVFMSLANNHMTNSGKKGMLLTEKTLSDNSIFFNGIRKGITQINMKETLVCLSSHTYDGGQGYQGFYRKGLSDSDFDDALQEMKDNSCDFKIFTIHWGSEYKFKASKNQKELAHRLIDQGVDMIVGSHSHILGEYEEYNGKPIFYSLGNFIFDQDWGSSGCLKGMDCIYDEQLKKKTVPTYIGTLANVQFEKTKKLISISFTKFRIKTGVLAPMN